MRFVDAYIDGLPAAAELLAPRFLDRERRSGAVDNACRPIVPAVRDAIRHASRHAPDTDTRSSHLAALDADNVSFVVTGQQLGLLGGPLYAVHKAACAIRFAGRLADESGSPVIPLFWLQAEDQDFAEIATTRIASPDGDVVRIEAPDEGVDRVSVAHRTVTGDPIRMLQRALRGLPFADEVMGLLGPIWTPGRPLVDAYAELMTTLFAEEGLLVLQPREVALAELAAPVHRWALDNCDAIAAALLQRAGALESAGFGAQVPVREACCLSFAHPEGAMGPRYRLRQCGERWEAAGSATILDEETVHAWLSDDPMRFSTSALLRPLVQDTVVPTAAYVGGPSEVAYLAQVAPLYPMLGIDAPLVVPRASWSWRPAFVDRLLADHELNEVELAAAAAAPPSEALAGPTGAQAAARLQSAVEHALDSIVAELDGLDAATIERASDKTRGTLARYIHRFGDAVDRARLAADPERSRALRIGRAWLQPDGAPQERTLGFAGFAATVGVGEFIDRTIAAADPLDRPPAEVPL